MLYTLRSLPAYLAETAAILLAQWGTTMGVAREDDHFAGEVIANRSPMTERERYALAVSWAEDSVSLKFQEDHRRALVVNGTVERYLHSPMEDDGASRQAIAMEVMARG